MGAMEGFTTTEAEAEAAQFLGEDLKVFEESVSRILEVGVYEIEFSSVVCLTCNIDLGGIAESTVIRKVIEQEWQEVTEAILLWNNVNGQMMKALVNRRKEGKENCF